jgi:hypothetical protein
MAITNVALEAMHVYVCGKPKDGVWNNMRY